MKKNFPPFPPRCLPVLASLTAATLCHAQPMVVAPDKADGVYQVGDTVRWTVEWEGGTNPPAARYLLKSGGLTKVGQGDLTFSNDIATLESKFDRPDTTCSRWIGSPIAFGAVMAPRRIKSCQRHRHRLIPMRAGRSN